MFNVGLNLNPKSKFKFNPKVAELELNWTLASLWVGTLGLKVFRIAGGSGGVSGVWMVRLVVVMRWFYFIHFISMSSNYSSHIIVSLHLIFGLIGSYLIWRLYSILEGHLPSYRYLVLWTLL